MILIIGLVIAAGGYVATIAGTIMLLRGAPQPHAQGIAPVGVDAWKGIAQEAERLEKWKKKAPWGHTAIVGGSSLQLLGTILMAVASLR